MKEYPLKASGTTITNVCECGHGSFMHHYKTRECEKCACPTYEFEQELTMTELIKLVDSIRRKNTKIGFTI